MHSLIVPIQLFPTSQRDIPFQRVLSSAEELRGKTVELGDSMERGKGKKKGRGKKRIVVGLLQIVSPCFPFFLFFLGRGRKLQEKYSAWKIKARGESLSYLLRGNHEKAKERLECIPFRIRKLS